MITVNKTLFTNSFAKGSSETDVQSVNKKISYWRQKLFDLQKEKKEKQYIDRTSTTQLQSQSYDDPISTQLISNTQEGKLAVEKGLKESVKHQVTKVEDDKQKLENMVSNSNRLLIGTSAIFPFDFFPNTINVEATRVNIIRRALFFSEVHSVDIKDISNVFLTQSLFFASLIIVSRTFKENEIKISKLWAKNAVEVRRIIEGLRMIVKADIDMNNYTVEELNNKLKELSSTEIVL